MNEIYIVQTCITPGIWDTIDFCYVNKLSAANYALSIMEASNKQILARVKSLKIIK